MTIPVILLNYNSSADCRKCISFLKSQRGVSIEIIIVDNKSFPTEREAISNLAKEQNCTLLLSEKNLGYNAGNNIGLRYANSRNYEYALIANPDMEFPQHNYIDNLLFIMNEKREVAVCGSNIISPDGMRQSPKRFTTYYEELLWPFPSIWRKLSKKHLILDAQNQYCDILMGSCILVRMDFIEKIGYFDENVFLYCEEVILGKQVKDMGMKMYYFNDVTAVHAHIPSQKGSFVKQHDIYWKSRWYYLTNYSSYSHSQMILLYLSKKIHYIFKRLQFLICGIK